MNFTDEQLQTLSRDYIQYPTNLSDLQLVKLDAVDWVASTLKVDQDNQLWTDFYLGEVISKYHEELKYLNDQVRTLYTGESLIQESGRRTETHFPATPPNIWANLQPKMLDANNGNPIGSYGGMLEGTAIADIIPAKDLIINGFADGSASTLSTAEYIIGSGQIEVDSDVGFSVGNRILVTGGGDALVATIDSIGATGSCDLPLYTDATSCTNNGGVWTPGTSKIITFTVSTEASGNIALGATVQNFGAGYNNDEREETIAQSPERLKILQIYKASLDSKVQVWDGIISNVQIPLALNGDKKRSANVAAELARVNSIIGDITTWQARPSTTTSSRFGDVELGELETSYNTRSSQISARITEIITALGSVAQATDGTYTGSGAYFDYFDWLNKRINVAIGSTAKYYGSLIVLTISDEKISQLNSSKSETETILRTEALSVDANGTDTVEVASVIGFAQSDIVKVMAEGQGVITTNILNIGVSTIQFATTIPTTYNLSSLARIVKEL